MSKRSIFSPPVLPHQLALQLVRTKPIPASTTTIRLVFCTTGILLAAAQAWVYRFAVSADSTSHLDMCNGVLPGEDWHRLINGVWSPLYPVYASLTSLAVSAQDSEPSGSLVLSRKNFAFSASCRFIPAHINHYTH